MKAMDVNNETIAEIKNLPIIEKNMLNDAEINIDNENTKMKTNIDDVNNEIIAEIKNSPLIENNMLNVAENDIGKKTPENKSLNS